MERELRAVATSLCWIPEVLAWVCGAQWQRLAAFREESGCFYLLLERPETSVYLMGVEEGSIGFGVGSNRLWRIQIEEGRQ